MLCQGCDINQLFVQLLFLTLSALPGPAQSWQFDEMTAGGPSQAMGLPARGLAVGMCQDAGAASKAAGCPPEPGRDLPVTELTATACHVKVFLQLYFLPTI